MIIYKGKKGGHSSDSKRDIGATSGLSPQKYFKCNGEQAFNLILKEIETGRNGMCHNNINRNGCNDAKAYMKQTEQSNEQRRVLEILGLTPDFLEGLEELPPEHYYHRQLCEWIEKSLEDNIDCLDSADKNHLTHQLLESIGFDPTSQAVETILKRSASAPSTQKHIEASEWPKIFVADEFKYNPSLSSSSDRFPVKSSLTDKWFYLGPDETKESENNCDHISRTKIMNVTTKECLSESTQDILVQDPEHIFLFHGTDHQSANNILATRGIYLNAGRFRRDFSHGKGFYLSKSMDNALDWAKCTTAKPAILIFRADRRLLNSAKKLSLFDNEKRWHEIVHSFRSGRKTAKTRQSLSAYDVIEGPMSTVRIDSDSDELVVEQKPSTYQMCLNSSEYAKTFQQTLHSVLFLDINE